MTQHNRDIASTDPTIYGSKSLTVYLKHRAWQSWWQVRDGQLHVFGAYGEKRKPIGRRADPEKQAKALLEEIVRNFEFNPAPQIHQTGRRRRD